MEAPSGLLDLDDPPDEKRQRSRTQRSRSQSEQPRQRGGVFTDAPDGNGKGAGKGKEGKQGKGETEPEQPKEEPNFEASGLLAMEDNSKRGIPLKFVMPPEARIPSTKWRLYIFTKGAEEPKILHIHRTAGYLFGKDRRVADVPTDHATCSKQHAVLHYRMTPGGVKPYIMDLESTNGTYVNGKRIESARYFELREKDVLKFGMSSREFVLLHGGSTRHQEIDPSLLRTPE